MAGFELYDVVTRSEQTDAQPALSDNLAAQAFALARTRIEHFIDTELGLDRAPSGTADDAFARFRAALGEAYNQGLVGHGGVPERNFLGLWLLADSLQPTLYVESGVFRGASMFAVAATNRTRIRIGFDPEPASWQAKLDRFEGETERYEHDFSDHSFDAVPAKALVYFDDHINTAQRLLQARDKGFKHLIFDDSCGLSGTIERKWPSLPSLFFIMNIDRFRAGDYLTWPTEEARDTPLFGGRMTLRRPGRITQNRFEITPEIIALCQDARAAIARCSAIPDLSDYVIPRQGPRASDLTQHFVVLA